MGHKKGRLKVSDMNAVGQGGALVARIIKPAGPGDELFATSIRLPKRMWEQLDEIAELGGLSRNETVIKLLDWAITEQLKGDEPGEAIPKKKR